MRTEEATTLPQPEQRQIAGSGGRLRTVWVCYSNCWHNSYGQADRCKAATAKHEAEIRIRAELREMDGGC